MTAWINEFHYDNAGADTGEFIELAGTAGTSLSGWSLVRYNGTVPSAAVIYASPGTITLAGVIPDQQGGFGTLSFALPTDGLQNGPNDGFALVDGGGAVVQLLSYEGPFTVAAGQGAASGQTSADVGVAETTTTPVGSSLALTGTGDSYDDFTWTVSPGANTAGAVNAGQTFGGGGGGETVSISDASVAEGDAGTALLTFTVTRTGNLGAFTVDFATADGTATTAGGDYLGAAGTLAFAAGGTLSQQVTVTVQGDAAAEPDETLTVALSNLANTAGTTTIADASGTGTILNDDVALTEIGAIQGAGHKAPSVGGAVGSFGNSGATRFNVEGVVTAIGTNGFWIQDPDGDGDVATSDGIFVFTSSAPAASIEVGETVRLLNVQVSEFRPGGSGGGNNLTITQLVASTGTLVELGGSTEIAPVVLGTDRVIPTGAVEDDGFATFDPANDAIDFWESLEGMLVQVPAGAVAVSPTNAFRTRDPANPANAEGPPSEEIWVRIPGDTDPSSLTPSGGLILGPTDPNPERIQLDDLLNATDMPDVDVGATLGAVSGVVSYDFANYEILVPTAPVVAAPSPIAPEVTAIARDARQVTVASYNVENLDPRLEDVNNVAGSDLYTRLGNVDDDVGSGKYARHAEQIVLNMGAPSIVALQEVQDNDGAEISSVVDSTETLQVLVDLIQAAYGITYAFAFENPPAPNQDGGQPNANIRPAFLYRPDQVTLLDTVRLTDPDPGAADGFAGDDFAASRKPLVGLFEANGVTLTVVDNHFNSKGGDNAIFGNAQPPVLSSELQRIEQAKIVNGYVDGLLAGDPDARVVVLGDLNDFAWSAPLRALTGTGADRVLTDLAEALLPVNERYSYNFEGNAQALDHTLVTDALLQDAAPLFDIVHVNSEFADQVSDHDPSVTRLDLRAVGERLTLGGGDDSLDGLGGDDTLSGAAGDDTLLGGAGDDSLFGNGGADSLDGGAGDDTAAGGQGDDTYAVDSAGDVVLEVAGEGTDTVVTAIAWTLGANLEDLVLAGGAGVRGIGNALANAVTGNAGKNGLRGLDGDDTLLGLGAKDKLAGGDGDDLLVGGDGRDRLDGGRGDDTLTGGADADLFVVGQRPGADTVADFEVGVDRISLLESGFGGSFDALLAATTDTADGALIELARGNSVLLLGVTEAQFREGDFLL